MKHSLRVAWVKMDESQFKIFKLGFYAGRNSGMKNKFQAEQDLDFWYKQFVMGEFFKPINHNQYKPTIFSVFWNRIEYENRPTKRKHSKNPKPITPQWVLEENRVHSKKLPDISFEKLTPRAKALMIRFGGKNFKI